MVNLFKNKTLNCFWKSSTNVFITKTINKKRMITYCAQTWWSSALSCNRQDQEGKESNLSGYFSQPRVALISRQIHSWRSVDCRNRYESPWTKPKNQTFSIALELHSCTSSEGLHTANNILSFTIIPTPRLITVLLSEQVFFSILNLIGH